MTDTHGRPSEQASLAAFLLGDGVLRRTEWEEPDRPERRVDDFLLLEPLGRGGMGVVYKAKDLQHQRTVALKLLSPRGRIGKTSPERLAREAYAAARLDHPNIARVLHVGELEGLPYVVMDLVEGETLAEQTAEGPLDPRRAAELTWTLAKALDCAHQQRVLHRDVKPGNVIIDRQGQPVLIDFGLAKVLDREGELTRTGQLLGTPQFMAPEQVRAASTVDGRADVYGLGATLYALLTGQPPFEEGSVVETVVSVLERPPVPPSSLTPRLSPELERICLRCLEKDPAERYPTAGAVAKELERFLGGTPLDVAPRESERRKAPPKRSERPTSPSQSPLLFAGLGLAALVVVLAVAGSGSEPSSVGEGLAPSLPGTEPSSVGEGLAPSLPPTGAPPTIELLSPTAGAALAERSLRVRVRVRDDDLARVEVQGAPAEPVADLDDAFEAPVSLQGAEGRQSLQVLAVDGAGNEARFEVRLTLDLTAPQVTVDTPTATNPARPPQRIQGRVEDATAVTLNVNGEEVTVVDGAFSHPLGAKPQAEVRLVARDAAGNEREVVHRWVVDAEPPELALDEPAPTLTKAAKLTLRGRVRDAHPPVSLRFGGGEVALTGERFEVSVPLEEGANELTFTVQDAAGNERRTELRVERDSTAPEVSLDESPPAELLAKKSALELSGRVSEADTSLTLNGKTVPCEERAFHAKVRLKKGENTIALLARDQAGNEGRLEVRVTYLRPRAGLIPKGTWWQPSQAQLLCAQKTGRALWFTDPLGVRFVLVPPGTFVMGSPPEEEGRHENEVPHTVELTRPFYLSATEVTNEELARLDPDHRSGSSFGYPGDRPRQPATQTTWGQARRFAAALSKLNPKLDYRLPTEAEWEYAARAGTTTPYYWGSDPAEAVAYCNGLDAVSHAEFGDGNQAIARRQSFPKDDGFRTTAPVASLKPNPWGLYDMLGNVDEWVADHFGDYPKTPVRDPLNTNGAQRIVRGGSYHMSRVMCRAAYRWRHDPEQAGVSSGIRLAAWPTKKRR